MDTAELSVSETTTFRWSFEEDAANYRAAGIAAMGVWRQKLSDCGVDTAAALLQKNRLKVSHLSWAGGFTGSDGRSYRESLEDAREALQSAAALGTDTLLVYSGPRAYHTRTHAGRLFKDALKKLAPQAAELGVCLAIEPMHPGCAADWTFLNSLDDVLSLINSLDSRHIRIVLDTYQLGFFPGLEKRIGEIVTHVALVQLGDGRGPPRREQNRCRLGEGVVPLREIVAALRSAGYAGYYDVELLGEELETMDYPARLEHAKKAFAELMGHAP
jgi:sugar phosphate isomerase/epimerase